MALSFRPGRAATEREVTDDRDATAVTEPVDTSDTSDADDANLWVGANARRQVRQASSRSIRKKPRTVLRPPPVRRKSVVKRTKAREQDSSRIRFMVSSFRFQGNTLFTTKQLHRIAKPYEARSDTLAQLRRLCLKIRQAYTARGYVLARAGIPPQRIRKGHVLISINEGRFGTIRVEGARHYSPDFLQEMFEPATESGIVRQADVERALLLINELPDISVRSYFDVGKVPGTTDMVLKVKDEKPLHFGLEYNDFGNTFVGRNRATASIWANSVFTDGDQVTGRLTYVFPSNSPPYYQFGYAAPIDNAGRRVNLAYAHSQTAVGEQLDVLSLKGDARIASANLSAPLQRTTHAATNFTAGMAVKNVDQFVFTSVPVSSDRLREITLAYDGSWLGEGPNPARVLGALVLTRGLGTGLGGTANGDPSSSRGGAGAGDDFTKGNADFAVLASLSSDLLVVFRVSGQLTVEPLTVPELFVLGGPDSVRGFIPAEFLGDYGFNASLELRDTLADSGNFNIQGVAFVDTGSANLKNALVGEVGGRALTGAGVGLRASIAKTTSVRLDLGFPLSGKVVGDASNVVAAQVASRF